MNPVKKDLEKAAQHLENGHKTKAERALLEVEATARKIKRKSDTPEQWGKLEELMKKAVNVLRDPEKDNDLIRSLKDLELRQFEIRGPDELPQPEDNDSHDDERSSSSKVRGDIGETHDEIIDRMLDSQDTDSGNPQVGSREIRSDDVTITEEDTVEVLKDRIKFLENELQRSEAQVVELHEQLENQEENESSTE